MKTRRWFLNSLAALCGLAGIKPLKAKVAMAAKPDKPRVIYNQVISQHGYLFKDLWINVELNAPALAMLSYSTNGPLTMVPVPRGKGSWIGFNSVDGLDASKPLTLTISSDEPFTVTSVAPHYQLPKDVTIGRLSTEGFS